MMTDGQHKRLIMARLAHGNPESLGSVESASATPEQEYQNFDDFAQRSSQSDGRGLFDESLQANHVFSGDAEPELKKAIAQIQRTERNKIAREFLKQLKKQGLSDRDLEQLSLSSCDEKYMTADDVAKLATYTYRNHLDIFQSVLAERPTLVKFLSNSLVGVILSAMAIRWLGNRRLV